jgi:hypothetical protein
MENKPRTYIVIMYNIYWNETYDGMSSSTRRVQNAQIRVILPLLKTTFFFNVHFKRILVNVLL